MNFNTIDYALYLPAVNLNYAKALASEVSANRPFPSGISLVDLTFWEKGSKLWDYEYFLHSVGHYSIGAQPDNAVTRRGPREGILFGDSAGYQIGKGSLQGLVDLKTGMTGNEAVKAWRQNIEAREWVVNWLETYTNYAMTIDMPLWAKIPKGVNSPFHKCTFDQLVGMTVENLRFIDRNRQGRTKWLNVIQGLTTTEMIKWWHKVRWFECSGYAFSSEGGKKNGLRALLEPLLEMRDGGAFKDGCDWIHFLGCSTAPWAIMLTAIQRGIQAKNNPKLRVSFDSSNPFVQGSKHESHSILPSFNANRKTWSIKNIKTPQSPKLVGSKATVPFSSPLANTLTLGDLNVREGNFTANQFEKFSHLFLMNHNVWVYLQTFETANDLAFSSSNHSQVPTEFKDCIDVIEKAFVVDDWSSHLSKHQKLLDNFKG